jgi:hypothetical protein
VTCLPSPISKVLRIGCVSIEILNLCLFFCDPALVRWLNFVAWHSSAFFAWLPALLP